MGTSTFSWFHELFRMQGKLLEHESTEHGARSPLIRPRMFTFLLAPDRVALARDGNSLRIECHSPYRVHHGVTGSVDYRGGVVIKVADISKSAVRSDSHPVRLRSHRNRGHHSVRRYANHRDRARSGICRSSVCYIREGPVWRDSYSVGVASHCDCTG